MLLTPCLEWFYMRVHPRRELTLSSMCIERIQLRIQKESIEDLRGAEYGNEFRNLQPDHKVQQWRKFLLNPQNRKALTIFVTKEWKQDKYRRKLTDKVLFVACEEECHQVSPEAAFTLKNLAQHKKKLIQGFFFISLMQPDQITAN